MILSYLWVLFHLAYNRRCYESDIKKQNKKFKGELVSFVSIESGRGIYAVTGHFVH